MADASCPVLLISGRCLPCWTAAGGAVAAGEDLELFTGTRPSLPVSLDRHRDVVLWNSTASTTNSCGDRWCRRGPTCWAWSSTWPASSTASGWPRRSTWSRPNATMTAGGRYRPAIPARCRSRALKQKEARALVVAELDRCPGPCSISPVSSTSRRGSVGPLSRSTRRST